MSKKVWGYGEVEYISGRMIGIRYIGLMSKKSFIEKVVEVSSMATRNWVRERVAETGNDKELELANQYIGILIKVNDRTGELIKIYAFRN